MNCTPAEKALFQKCIDLFIVAYNLIFTQDKI